MEYEPLRADLEEIRVVTILPASPDGLVHCTIDVVSLAKSTVGNKHHSSLPKHTNESKRPELATWISGTARDGTSTTEVAKTANLSQYRFEWGDYACLSYCWGDQKKTTRIVANGTEIQVTSNLEACLQAMQQSGG